MIIEVEVSLCDKKLILEKSSGTRNKFIIDWVFQYQCSPTDKTMNRMQILIKYQIIVIYWRANKSVCLLRRRNFSQQN